MSLNILRKTSGFETIIDNIVQFPIYCQNYKHHQSLIPSDNFHLVIDLPRGSLLQANFCFKLQLNYWILSSYKRGADVT